METITYTLPAYWASYLFNGDHSSLTESEKLDIDAFREREGLGDPVDISDSYVSRYNDFDNKLGDVCDYKFPIKE